MPPARRSQFESISMTRQLKQFAPIVATVAMLIYIAGFARLEIVTTGVDAFMERSRTAIAALPTEVRGWRGERLPMEAQAIDLLRPNAERRIHYRTLRDSATYSVIQAADSRFMTGHAPMNCYPNGGYQTLLQEDRVWQVGEFKIKGIEYGFKRKEANGFWKVLNVRNFFIFPDGHFGATLRELEETAQDYRR